MLNDSFDPSDDGVADGLLEPARRDQAQDGSGAQGNGRGNGLCAQGRAADVLAAVATAVLCPDRTEGERQLCALVESGIAPTDLIDVHIPAAARHFGDAWMASGHSFSEVTIAVARLQQWLRDLDGRRCETPFRFDAPEILLVVAEGSQHTLGAMVAMSRFRRLGALVRLSLGQDARAVGQIARTHHFDMIALSAAGNEDLDFLGSVITSIRSGVGPAPRIVLGGEILNQHSDASALVGADFLTSDPEEALSLCGLTISADAGLLPTTRIADARGQPARVPTEA